MFAAFVGSPNCIYKCQTADYVYLEQLHRRDFCFVVKARGLA